MLTTIFLLLIAFQLKHFLCDYPLQGRYMLGKFKKEGWEIPLAAHAAVHFVGTFLIAIFFGFKIALAVAALDFFVHFVVDKIKVEASRSTDHSKPEFWWYLGLDQMAHHLTHYAIIAILVLL